MPEQPIALPLLRALARRYPNADAVLAEIGYLEAVLALPRGTVHVVSDVHGEHKKLKHIVNNASGSLRTFVERLFAGRASPAEIGDLLALLYYPREAYAWQARRPGFDRRAFLLATLAREVEVIRELSRRYTLRHAEKLFPPALAGLFRELVSARGIEGRPAFVEALVGPFLQAGRDLDLLRAAAHVVRNLSVAEIVVAGDLGDRGPRLDRVIDLLTRQPSVAVVWGNHDASWMGACLGQPALIATVLRISLRYRRLSPARGGVRHHHGAGGEAGAHRLRRRPGTRASRSRARACATRCSWRGCRRRWPSSSSSWRGRRAAATPSTASSTGSSCTASTRARAP